MKKSIVIFPLKGSKFFPLYYLGMAYLPKLNYLLHIRKKSFLSSSLHGHFVPNTLNIVFGKVSHEHVKILFNAD